jgi:hypothetical protein
LENCNMAEVLVRVEEQLDANTYEYAQTLDKGDPLGHLRAEFIIPTKSDLKSKTLAKPRRQICPLSTSKPASNHASIAQCNRGIPKKIWLSTCVVIL